MVNLRHGDPKIVDLSYSITDLPNKPQEKCMGKTEIVNFYTKFEEELSDFDEAGIIWPTNTFFRQSIGKYAKEQRGWLKERVLEELEAYCDNAIDSLTDKN